MSKSSQPSVSIPTYQNPTPTDFNTPYGSLNYANGAYNYNSANPSSDTEMATLRDAIASHLGVTGSEQLAQNQDWQTAFYNAAAKNAAPQLSNQMFNAGLGGSSAYSSALADLHSNLATQAVLNGQQLNLANTQSLQNSLSGINGVIGQNQNYALGLTGAANNYNAAANHDASLRYGQLLQTPGFVTTNNNQGTGYGQLIGTVGGGIAGAFMGNPMLGAQLGGALGGGIDSGMGNQSFGGSAINGGLAGLGALNGAGFFNGGGRSGINPSALQSFGGGTAQPYQSGGNMQYSPSQAANTQGLQFSVFK